MLPDFSDWKVAVFEVNAEALDVTFNSCIFDRARIISSVNPSQKYSSVLPGLLSISGRTAMDFRLDSEDAVTIVSKVKQNSQL